MPSPLSVFRYHDAGVRRPLWRIAFLALVALFASLLAATPAQAANPHATEADLTIAFVDEEVASGTHTEISGTWSLPDNPATPAGFSLPLPPELEGRTDDFPMTDGGVQVGTCSITATELHCDVDDAYVAANPLGLNGTFSFWVKVLLEVDEGTPFQFSDDYPASITVNPGYGVCDIDCFEDVNLAKYGYYMPDDPRGDFEWYVYLAAPEVGATGGERVVVKDVLGANQAHSAPPEFRLTKTLVTKPDGNYGPYPFVLPTEVPLTPAEIAQSDVQFSADNSEISFVALPGYFYELKFYSAVTDNFAQRTYSNVATVTIDGDAESVETEAAYWGGNATGVGTNVGRFTITEDVIGDGATAVPSTQSYTGTYTVTMPPSTVATHTGTFTVLDGETWTSPDFPRGSQVHLTEVTPTAPATVAWTAPVFNQNDFTLAGGSITGVTLTNQATLLPPTTGTFSASKALTGTGASLVPKDATFTLAYTYPAGEGFAAGSGSVTLGAAGSPVSSSPLPVGAVLTFTEVAPAAVSGASWGTATITPATLTITQGTSTTAVVVTNPIVANVTAAPPTLAPSQTKLPDTGFSSVLPAVLGLGLFVAGGAALLIRRRRAV